MKLAYSRVKAAGRAWELRHWSHELPPVDAEHDRADDRQRRAPPGLLLELQRQTHLLQLPEELVRGRNTQGGGEEPRGQVVAEEGGADRLPTNERVLVELKTA